MRVLVLGIADFSFLFQNTYTTFKEKFKDTTFFNVKKYKKISKHISKSVETFFFRKHLYSKKPDLIFIVAPYYIKEEYYKIINEFKTNNDCLVFGWIGDKFEDNDLNRFITNTLDKKFITDSYFNNLYKDDDVIYLPLCTSPKIFNINKNQKKEVFSSFVASRTPYRENFISEINFYLNVYGTGWERLSIESNNNYLNVSPKKTTIYKTANIYKKSKSVLNLTNEFNVIDGLNQRSFDPYLTNTIVLQEDCKDLELCFEPNKEIIVFENIEDLKDKVNYFLVNSKEYLKVLDKGKKRVLCNHTYQNRIEKVLKEI